MDATALHGNGAAHAGETMQACELARTWLLFGSNDRNRGNSCGSMRGCSVPTRSLGCAVVSVCAGSGLGYRNHRIDRNCGGGSVGVGLRGGGTFAVDKIGYQQSDGGWESLCPCGSRCYISVTTNCRWRVFVGSGPQARAEIPGGATDLGKTASRAVSRWSSTQIPSAFGEQVTDRSRQMVCKRQWLLKAGCRHSALTVE